MSRLVGGGLVVTTLLTSIGIFGPESSEPDVISVTDDESLLSEWPSEDWGSTAPPECTFFNFSVVYRSELCSHFVTTRPSSTPGAAFGRAIRCAARHRTECVLSPEVGLAVPAAFLVPPSGQIRMVLAPRIVASPPDILSEEKHVRVHHPSPGLVGNTKTVTFNSSVTAEYMDGRSRAIHTTTFFANDAYCVQLLRRAFVPECWAALD